MALGFLGAFAPVPAPAQAGGDPYQAIVTREFGTAVEELATVDKEVSKSAPEQFPQIEAKLIAVLDAPNATMPGKQFACQMLRIVGSAKCVPAVAKLLTDEKLSHIARQVFLGMINPAVEESLRQALGQTQGNLRIGIINTIGDRKDQSSLKSVAVLVSGQDEATARAALNAIGKIGGAAAAGALDGAKVPDALKAVWGDAYLRCAGSVEPARAEKMCRALFEGDQALPVRAGAFGALVQMQKEQAVPLILKAMSANEPLLRRAALGAVLAVPGNAATRAFAKELSSAVPETKVVLLTALAARGDAEGLTEMVNKLATDENETIRAAAFKALARLGDASSVPVLAAALKQKETSASASQTLIDLQGAGVAEALLKQAEAGDPAIRSSLLTVLAERRQTDALPLVRKSVNDDDAKVRRAALKSLAALGTQQDLAMLAELVVTRKDDAERDQTAQALSDLGARMTNKAARCEPVLQAFAKAEGPAKVSLLTVLSTLGGDKALAAVRGALTGEGELRKASVRALAEWPDAAPMADLLAVAKDDKEKSSQILALRGYIRMVGISGARSQDRAKSYSEALALAARPEERKLAVTGLADVAHADALKMVEPFLEDPTLQREAFVAYEKIAESLVGKQPALAKEALQRVTEKATDAGLRSKAKKALDKIK